MTEKLTVFIDFDGVFHPLGSCAWLEDEQRHHFVKPFRWWPEFRDALKPLHTQVQLVVHSTWRLQWEFDAELKAFMPPEMAAMVVGTTPREVASRFASIEAYVAKHRLTRFVAIDDEADAFPPGYENVVLCDGNLGIEDEDAQAALYLKVKAALEGLAQH